MTGIVGSTSKHEAIPRNAGFGFSGVEDFNMLWADAHNEYEDGNITHFAMLHGDITPDPSVKWLDVLIEEMERNNAALVSTVSPIKDGRGVTSSGICDLDDPWMPWRRFTIREVLNELPETFNNVQAGYPDRPLLHNTCLWVADLRWPVFHRTNEAGELDMYFAFPTRASRDEDGRWRHQRQSEDWLFSRDLWERGIRDTYITSRVKLIHTGHHSWGTYTPHGTYVDGDEDTAYKWRAELDVKPLRPLQMIQFELGTRCNLSSCHEKCPNLSPKRYASLDASMEMSDETIVTTAVEAYEKHGFTGMIGWICYNEPLLQMKRMFTLMREIKWRVPTAQFILWTNGTLVPEDCTRFQQFRQIVVSNYGPQSEKGFKRLEAAGVDATLVDAPLDDRLVGIPPQPEHERMACLRPFVELIFDNFGNSHICCYDWQGKGTLGNIHTTPLEKIAASWRQMLPDVCGQEMSDEAPGVCKQCGFRWDKYQQHDEAIVQRARRLRESWEQEGDADD